MSLLTITKTLTSLTIRLFDNDNDKYVFPNEFNVDFGSIDNTPIHPSIQSLTYIINIQNQKHENKCYIINTSPSYDVFGSSIYFPFF